MFQTLLYFLYLYFTFVSFIKLLLSHIFLDQVLTIAYIFQMNNGIPLLNLSNVTEL